MNLHPAQWSRQEMQENMMNFTFLIAAIILASFIVGYLSNLLAAWRNRKPGDGILEVIKAIKEEKAARKRAREMMFGSKLLYIASFPANLLIMLFYTEATVSQSPAHYGLNLYFLAGIAITIFMRFKDRVQWEKLSFGDKGYFYLVHAWFWPWPLLKRLYP